MQPGICYSPKSAFHVAVVRTYERFNSGVDEFDCSLILQNEIPHSRRGVVNVFLFTHVTTDEQTLNVEIVGYFVEIFNVGPNRFVFVEEHERILAVTVFPSTFTLILGQFFVEISFVVLVNRFVALVVFVVNFKRLLFVVQRFQFL